MRLKTKIKQICFVTTLAVAEGTVAKMCDTSNVDVTLGEEIYIESVGYPIGYRAGMDCLMTVTAGSADTALQVIELTQFRAVSSNDIQKFDDNNVINVKAFDRSTSHRQHLFRKLEQSSFITSY